MRLHSPLTDEVTRDFVENVTKPLIRQARLLPWIPTDMTDVSYTQEEPDMLFFTVLNLVLGRLLDS